MKKDFTKQTTGELAVTLAETAKKLHALQLGLSKIKTKNVKEAANLKKDIARIMTIMHAPANKKA